MLSIRIALYDALPERVEQNVDLNDDGIDEESVGEGGKSMGLDECHQKTKTYQHHHIHILKYRIPFVDQMVLRLLSFDPHVKGIENDDYNFSSN